MITIPYCEYFFMKDGKKVTHYIFNKDEFERQIPDNLKYILEPKACRELLECGNINYSPKSEGELSVFLIESRSEDNGYYDMDDEWEEHYEEYQIYHQINYEPISGQTFEFKNDGIYDLTMLYEKWSNFLKSLPAHEQTTEEARRVSWNLARLDMVDYYFEEKYYPTSGSKLNLAFLELTQEELNMFDKE